MVENTSPSWGDLPLDLIGNISSHLHAATDYVRFHAACQPLRDTLPPPSRRPAFLPWILSPRDATGHRKARCVFSAKSSRRAATATEILVRDRRWVIGADGRASACLIDAAACPKSSTAVVDPLTLSAAAIIPLPRCQDETKTTWNKQMGRAVGVVTGDGTILLYAYGHVDTRTYCGRSFDVALMRPGDAAWTFVQGNNVSIYRNWHDCCVAYRGGAVVVCHESSWWLVPTPAEAAVRRRRQSDGWVQGDPSKVFESSYLVESQGELLWAFVQVNRGYCRHVRQHGIGVVEDLTDALSVSVYSLKEEEGSEPEWVEKDDMSFVDRVMFLGRPRSFAMDAAQIGFISGCAYFVVRSRAYGGIWSKLPLERCRLFRYCFQDAKSEFVEQLPEDWNDDYCMWLTPQPALAPSEEIRQRVEALNPKAGMSHGQLGTYFRIHVGNLPRKVDNYQLRQFFSKYGKVADARVMCAKGTGRSRGFGFVTMATHVEDEPADATARLHGQILDGRILQVKFAHQEGDVKHGQSG